MISSDRRRNSRARRLARARARSARCARGLSADSVARKAMISRRMFKTLAISVAFASASDDGISCYFDPVKGC